MKKSDIRVGALYTAKVSNKIVTVRVDAIRETTTGNGMRGLKTGWAFDVTNLSTGRKTTFRSAAKFRSVATRNQVAKINTREALKSILPTEETLKAAAAREAANPTPPNITARVPPTEENEQRKEQTYGVRCPGCGRGEWAVRRHPSDPAQDHFRCKLCKREWKRYDVTVKEDEQRSDPPRTPRSPTTSSTPPATSAVPTSCTASSTEKDVDAEEGENGADPTQTTLTDTSSTYSSADPQTSTGSNGLGAMLAAQLGESNALAASATVAGYTPTAEQRDGLEKAVELFSRKTGPRVLVLVAGAGAGKTSELKMMEEVLQGRGQYTAFNKSLVNDSKPKFKRANCNTTHSLAFRDVGRRYAHRLGGARVRSDQIAMTLGIEGLSVETGGTRADGTPATKFLKPSFLAGQVLVAIRTFCQSADHAISASSARHFKYIDGIDQPTTDGKRTYANNERVRQYLLPFAVRAWADLMDPAGTLPFAHDVYVKLWQLGVGGKPFIPADYILLDEYQDTAPVFVDILKQQTHAMLIMVGDDNQRIYEWRGAINAGDEFPDAPRSILSQSFRFGQAIADVANTILDTLEEATDLVMTGLASIPSRVAPLDTPRCILCRTNAGAVSRVLRSVEEGRRPHLIGGGSEVVAFVKAARDLQDGRGTSHPELGCFTSWAEVQEYSKLDEGEDLKLMVKLVDEFSCEAILGALENMPAEKDADLVVSTAHKSKGREWDSVKLADDFPLANRMSDPDRRLLYVAATRAKYQLDVSSCPPFCGGESRGETGNPEKESVWVPGLEIKYTKPQPTEEELTDWVYAKTEGVPATSCSICGAATYPTPAGWQCTAYSSHKGESAYLAEEKPTVQVPLPNGFTWSKYQETWGVRGPAGHAGKRVIVAQRNGTTSEEQLGEPLAKFPEAWIYELSR